MSEAGFQIGARGVDTLQIVQDIQAAVRDKMQKRLYTDARVARAERTNLQHLKDDETFFSFYMECLHESVFVDIGDFEIRERRPRFSQTLIWVKQLVWKTLKFYTYRLWSQQNQVNGLLLSAIDSVDARYRTRMAQMESRIATMESGCRQCASKQESGEKDSTIVR